MIDLKKKGGKKIDWDTAWPILKFILIFVVVHFSFQLLYNEIYLPYYEGLNPKGSDPFTFMVARHAASMLRMFGYDSQAGDAVRIFGSYVSLNGNRGITVIPGCSGANNVFLLLTLLLAFPGPIKKKLWYLPLAVVVFHFSNILRISLLTMLYNGTLKEYYYIIKPMATYVSHITLFFIFVLWLKISLRK